MTAARPPVKTRTLTFFIFLTAAAWLVFSIPGNGTAGDRSVRVLTVDGAIDPVVSAYLLKEIDLAESSHDDAVLIRMDTPGGLDISMRAIIKRIMGSRVPVIVYTAPPGARAASAGAIISLSAHVAAMAPGTNIGAAHPVNLGGGEQDKELSKKAENDAAAFVRGIAKERGRNVNWAEDAVRESVSITADEAKKLGVIEIIARSDRQVLNKADGMTVEIRGKERRLDLAGGALLARPMGVRQRILHGLIDPNIVFILLMLGVYGIIYEMANPGFGFSGIGGGICLILALYGPQALPLNLAGLALIILAFILFVAEAMTPTFGVLAGGGLISLVVGGLILVDTPRSDFGVSVWLIIPVALITLGFLMFVVRSALLTHRRGPKTGAEGMIGLRGTAVTDIDPGGRVRVHGEIWTAIAADGPIAEGQNIEVTGIDGLKLQVGPLGPKEEK